MTSPAITPPDVRTVLDTVCDDLGDEGLLALQVELARRIAEVNSHAADTAATVFDRWQSEGPLLHQSTGIGLLDEMTGGGLPFGTRCYLLGAPDAGKTALAVQWADSWLEAGLVVGILAVDEDPGDLVGRLLQRRKWSRRDCEQRDPDDLATMRKQFGNLRLRLYRADWTIEKAAQDVAEQAREAGLRGALIIDSVQTATCTSEMVAGREMSRYLAVSARVQAIREVADRHRLIVVSTSEMGRAFYRTNNEIEKLDELAGAKESGGIEYSARVLLALRSVPGQSDLLELRVSKNKHGPRHRQDEHGIHFRIDRVRQVLVEAIDYTPLSPTGQGEAKREARAERARAQTTSDAAAMAVILASAPAGLSARGLESAMRARLGTASRARVDTARARLGQALVERAGPRNASPAWLDGSALPPEVAEAVPLAERPAVVACRPPADSAPESGRKSS